MSEAGGDNAAQSAEYPRRGLLFGQQEVEPTLFGALTADPSLPPNVLTVCAPAADPEGRTASVLAPLTVPTVSEEQAPLRNSNTPPPSDQPQALPSNQAFQAAPSELLFGEQETHPTYFGSLTIDPSLPPNVLTVRPPDADPELGVTPVEEVCRDHSFAELVGGWGL